MTSLENRSGFIFELGNEILIDVTSVQEIEYFSFVISLSSQISFEFWLLFCSSLLKSGFLEKYWEMQTDHQSQYEPWHGQ